jgi:hypothetical protein
VRKAGVFLCVNSLNDGRGEDDMLYALKGFGGEDERIRMS